MSVLIDIIGLLGSVLFIFVILVNGWKYIRRIPRHTLEKKWIIVTGCDSGIGQGVMEKLIAENASIIACTYTEKGQKNALSAGAKYALQFDLTNESAAQNAAQEISRITDGNLWGLVHNAGMVQPGFVEYLKMDVFRRVFEINYFAVVRMTQGLIPALKKAGGRLVIVSSVDGIVSLPGNAPYDSAKFAIEAFADAMRVELSFWNVSVSVINPSTMRTPLAMNFFEAHRKSWEQMNEVDPNGEWKKFFTSDWLNTYVEQGKKQLETIAQDPKHVMNDILHALSAKHPKLRYLSGTTAKTLFLALWKMPEEWSYAVKKVLVQPPPENAAND